MPKFFLFVIGIILLVPLCLAEELPEHFFPIKPLAIGGAYTAIANDQNAIWTNPAGITRVKKARSRKKFHLIQFPNIIGGANQNGPDFYKLTKNDGSSIPSEASIKKADAWAAASAYPMMIFSIGSTDVAVTMYTHSTLNASVDSVNTTLANVKAISDIGGVLTLGWANRTNRFSSAIQLRPVNRFAYEKTLPMSVLGDNGELQSNFKSGANKSTALAIDAGVLMTFADFWYPTLGLSILNAPSGGCKKDFLNPYSKLRENVCGTVYQGSFSNPEAVSTVDPTDIRIGFSISPRLARRFGMRLALDVHHFYLANGENSYGFDGVATLKKTHGGIQFYTGNPLLPSPITVSFGMGQGLLSAGFSVDIGGIVIEAATFGTDVSSDPSPKEDRRAIVGISYSG